MTPPSRKGVALPSDTLYSTTEVVVTAVEALADGVVGLTLHPRNGEPLPGWTPGAHIDLILPSGLVRQYSLCDESSDGAYRVAVLLEPAGRGGSRELHSEAEVGLELSLRGPRNQFLFVKADSYLFIAGGIGITPLIPMLKSAASAGADWRLVYGGRSLSTMAYADDLLRLDPDRVTILPEDSAGRPDIDALLDQVDDATLVYACGPEGLLTALSERASARGAQDRIHLERFSAAPSPSSSVPTVDRAFDLELARSGVTVHVPADQSIYHAVQDADTDLMFSCTEGYCGTCQVQVVDGEPDHRDSVAMPEEHDAEGSMIICVGRALSSRLVIDA
jgi:ferredoxin-NADP reductase